MHMFDVVIESRAKFQGRCLQGWTHGPIATIIIIEYLCELYIILVFKNATRIRCCCGA